LLVFLWWDYEQCFIAGNLEEFYYNRADRKWNKIAGVFFSKTVLLFVSFRLSVKSSMELFLSSGLGTFFKIAFVTTMAQTQS
jgi:hypothetical protein